MTEPNENMPNAPLVVLGDKAWPVPKLAPRQFRRIWSDMFAVTDALDGALPLPEGDGDTFDLPQRTMLLSTEAFEKLQNVVFVGLTRAHPNLTEDEFLDMEATPPQLVHAFLVVRAQTGMFKPRDTAAEGGKPGEGSGAVAP